MDDLQHLSALYFEVKAVTRFLARYKNQYGASIKYLELERILPFVLFLIRDQKKVYSIGIPTLHEIQLDEKVTLKEVFNKKMWIDEDFDLLVAPKGDERNKRHKIQMVRFTGNVQANTENLFNFLVEKKFKIQRDKKLLLLVLLEKALKLKYLELGQKLKETNVPYGQIFLLGTSERNKTDVFFCFQIHPVIKTLGVLDPSSLRN
jgi:hypothetical protein